MRLFTVFSLTLTSALFIPACSSRKDGALCGNNVIEESEVCDGLDLGGQTCQHLGYDSGQLACLPSCDGFDVSGCNVGEPEIGTEGGPCRPDGSCDAGLICEAGICTIADTDICKGGTLDCSHLDDQCFVGVCSEQDGGCVRADRTDAPFCLGTMSTQLFHPYVDFVLESGVYTGNPFDVIVEIEFVHFDGNETIRSEAFYDGDWDESTGQSTVDRWIVRFSGIKTGEWFLSTHSENDSLDGYGGRIIVEPQENPLVQGGKKNHGRWWTIIGHNGEERPFVPIIYHHEENSLKVYVTSFSDDESTRDNQIEELITIMKENHANVAVVGVMAAWTDKDSRAYGLYRSKNPEDNPQNPDIRSFVVLEELAFRLAIEGMELHLWKWRDEDGSDYATPTHIGGINGEQDRRLQRYIAARLGPILNWHMTYGIDLHEDWVSPNAVLDWYDYMHSHMGWFHHLSARERFVDQGSGTFILGTDKLDYHSDDHKVGVEEDMYTVTTEFVDAAPQAPFVYERRFLHNRDNIWDMDKTRRAMWQFWMAGGATAVWGRMWGTGTQHYPNPEQIGIFRTFWETHARLDYERANSLTDGYALMSSNGESPKEIVVYKENTSSVRIDLLQFNAVSRAIAVDTRGGHYDEIDILSSLAPGANNTWNAPSQSDWALYIEEN